MANLSVPYLVAFPGAKGPRYFWQPCRRLRAAGYRPQRVPLNWQTIAAGELEGAAMAAARAINLHVAAAGGLAAAAPAAAAVVITMAALVASFRVSKHWRVLRPTTQRSYAGCLRVIETAIGARAVAAIDAPAVGVLLGSLESTPAYALAVSRVLRLLLEFARRTGLITVNPALRPGLRAASAESAAVWPADAVAAFAAVADGMGYGSVGTAVLLNEWLGQRQADILSMPRTALREGVLHLTQHKTGARVLLPVGMVRALAARLELEDSRQLAQFGRLAPTILVNDATGRAWSESAFRRAFGLVRAAVAADVPGGFAAINRAGQVGAGELTFRLLRHTAVTRLAEAEVDLPGIAAITGHTLASVTHIVERYMVRTARAARTAFARRLAAEAGLTAAA